MRVFSQLMGSQPQAQALIQAPSADLIRPDNEFVLPEMEEVQIEMEAEKLENYESAVISCKLSNVAINREKLLHLLKCNHFKAYDRLKVDGFMKRYINYASKNLHLGNDIWWRWIELKDYRHPLPYRVVNKIKTICASEKNVVFFISDIVLITHRSGSINSSDNIDTAYTKWVVIPTKRKTEICFLRIITDIDALVEESIIIDAWRGPTFSDEEAKI